MKSLSFEMLEGMFRRGILLSPFLSLVKTHDDDPYLESFACDFECGRSILELLASPSRIFLNMDI